MMSTRAGADFGATPTGGKRYGHTPRGTGRWCRIPNLGTLWTDDTTSLQLASIPDADRVQANAVRRGLLTLAEEGVPVSVAFDRIAADNNAVPVTGDLADLPRT